MVGKFTVGTLDMPMDENFVDNNDLFYLGLDYDIQPAYSGLSASKNGNISTQKWWHRGKYNQSYSYNYDFLDRLKAVKHGEFGAVGAELKNYYNEDFNYDIRGNIIALTRKGLYKTELPGCYLPITIDSLNYTYAPNSNMLDKVVDKAPCQDYYTLPEVIDREMHYAANIKIYADHTTVKCNAFTHLTAGTSLDILDSLKIPASCATAPTVIVDKGPCPDKKYTDGFNQQSTDSYIYDQCGNTTYDPHKKLNLLYNHLNLPYRIIGAEGDTLFQLYSANGTLLQRKYKRGSTTVYKRDYTAGKEYLNDTLELIHHEDGRVIKNGSALDYEYNIKDHLGNVRVTFADVNGDHILSGSEVRSRNDYYAFGMEQYTPNEDVENHTPENKYRYNGKEYVEDMNWKVLDYGARSMDPTIGRFLHVDLLAGKFPSQSPYNYVENNPIRYIDPTGAYKIDPKFAKSHPGLVKLINYVLPQLAYNAKVRDAWTRETGLSNQDFYNMVTPGQGPWLTPSVSNPKDPYAHGPYTDEKTQTGFNRGEMGVDYKNNIFLGPDDSGLAKFESDFSQAMQSCDPSCVEESMFVLSMAIVHESGHSLWR
jgi:RHS repeat-associated protein